jgi:excinuclease UvrABC ATPase subunit
VNNLQAPGRQHRDPEAPADVFTGVSGSGKSSLVFGTIAAESQRMINETYSAFVQGFMPTLARPEVDVLDRLTTAIIVGRIVFEGTPTDLVTARSTLTGEHLAAYVGT